MLCEREKVQHVKVLVPIISCNLIASQVVGSILGRGQEGVSICAYLHLCICPCKGYVGIQESQSVLQRGDNECKFIKFIFWCL